MNLTINELARKTGFSSYEIRRRIHNGTLPHTRVGTKQTKILIDEDVFKKLLQDESIGNIARIKNNYITDIDSTNTVGYDKLRKIN